MFVLSLKKNKKGISIIELLLTIAIIGIVTTLAVQSFSSLSNSESLDKDVTNVVSFINKAKNNAINSLDFKEHGVKFASSSLNVFYGKFYTASATSTSYSLSSSNIIWNVSFSNSSTTLYFNKLTGEPSATGTITVKHGSTQKIITIYATGFVDAD